jgi:hypothetical protein
MTDSDTMSALQFLVECVPSFMNMSLAGMCAMALAQEDRHMRALYDAAICEIYIVALRQRGNVPENDIQSFKDKHAQCMATVHAWVAEQDMDLSEA